MIIFNLHYIIYEKLAKNWTIIKNPSTNTDNVPTFKFNNRETHSNIKDLKLTTVTTQNCRFRWTKICYVIHM